MKKILLIIFLLTFLIKTPQVYAQADGLQWSGEKAWQTFGKMVGAPLPGLECGVAGEKDDVDKCCNVNIPNVTQQQQGNQLLPQNIQDFLVGVLNSIPVLGGITSAFQDKAKEVSTRYEDLRQLQSNNANMACIYGTPSTANAGDPNCRCIDANASNNNRAIAQLCYRYSSKTKELSQCLSCATQGNIWTALGCVPTNFQSFVSNFLLSIGIGFGGIVALLCIIYSAFMMQTSQGNPEKIKKAQENLTSCILGLMLIIFSVFIMRVIGIDILRIPFITK